MRLTVACIVLVGGLLSATAASPQNTAAVAAATDVYAAGGWAAIRQHSAFHRDTLADRIHPAK